MSSLAQNQTEAVFPLVVELRRQSRSGEALEVLRDAIRRGRLDAQEIDKAGRMIRKELSTWEAGRLAGRVLILGQCTTSWLTTSLAAVAWGRGSAVGVREGEYDNVMQEFLAARDRADRPDVVVLVPWSQRLLSDTPPRAAQERIDEELAFWQQAWRLATEALGSRVVQVGYDCTLPGPMGYHLAGSPEADVGLVRQVNEALRRHLPAGAYFVDLPQVAGAMGRRQFYDPRRYFWTRQPFSEAGLVRLAEHVWAGVRAVLTGPKKALVVDLDNTLWGGVVGETGPLGIVLGESPDGEAFLAFQRHLKGLARRGILLAVCSKNNPGDAREPFQKNPHMVLALDDFADFQACWDPKAEVLRRIARTLQLGIDSFVFFDDNPAEREQVRQALPEVEVVDVPEDPAEYVRALDAGLWFESAGMTREDCRRSEQYQQEARRRQCQAEHASLDDYLRSLDMRADVRAVDEADLPRVVQLIGKTNQFNLTTRRHSIDEVRRLLAQPGAIGLSLRLVDRFGDYGLVAVILAVPEAEATGKTGTDVLRIDTFLMSCRVIGRTVEEFLFNALLDRARRQGCRSLLGEYLPTAKNALVAELYDRLGLARLADSTTEGVGYAIAVDGAAPARTFVQPA